MSKERYDILCSIGFEFADESEPARRAKRKQLSPAENSKRQKHSTITSDAQEPGKATIKNEGTVGGQEKKKANKLSSEAAGKSGCQAENSIPFDHQNIDTSSSDDTKLPSTNASARCSPEQTRNIIENKLSPS